MKELYIRWVEYIKKQKSKPIYCNIKIDNIEETKQPISLNLNFKGRTYDK